MNEEIIKSVLEESLEGQKETTVSVGLLTAAVENISDRITAIESKAENLKITAPETDLKPVKDLLRTHLQIIQALVEAQPKEVQQINRTVLFPIEGHKLEFYKAVLGQFFKWATILIIALAAIFKLIAFLER